MLRQSVSALEMQAHHRANPIQHSSNSVSTSAVTILADDSGKLTARQVLTRFHCKCRTHCSSRIYILGRIILFVTIKQYVPAKPDACDSDDSTLLAKMEKALFQVQIRS
jgi:hypothetical protein